MCLPHNMVGAIKNNFRVCTLTAQKGLWNKHVTDNDTCSQTYVKSCFLVDNESNFTDCCLRLRMLCTELVTLTKHAVGDSISRVVQRTCSQSWNGKCPQLTLVCRLKNVLDEVSKTLNSDRIIARNTDDLCRLLASSGL